MRYVSEMMLVQVPSGNNHFPRLTFVSLQALAPSSSQQARFRAVKIPSTAATFYFQFTVLRGES